MTLLMPYLESVPPDKDYWRLEVDEGAFVWEVEVFAALLQETPWKKLVFRLCKVYSASADGHISQFKNIKEFPLGEAKSRLSLSQAKVPSFSGVLNRMDIYGGGICLCDQECGELCCLLTESSEINELFFMGEWSKYERGLVEGALSNGRFPPEIGSFWANLGLKFGGNVIHIIRPGTYQYVNIRDKDLVSINKTLEAAKDGADSVLLHVQMASRGDEYNPYKWKEIKPLSIDAGEIVFLAELEPGNQFTKKSLGVFLKRKKFWSGEQTFIVGKLNPDLSDILRRSMVKGDEYIFKWTSSDRDFFPYLSGIGCGSIKMERVK